MNTAQGLKEEGKGAVIAGFIDGIGRFDPFQWKMQIKGFQLHEKISGIYVIALVIMQQTIFT